jgi:hypothetical protein
MLRQAATARIDPDAGHSKRLRCGDVPLEIVSNHPRIRRLHGKRAQCPLIDALIRLSKSQLPFNKNGVEEIGKLEARNLFPLRVLCAVSQQRKTSTRVAKPPYGVDGFGQRFHADVAPMAVRVAYAAGELCVVDAKIDERKPYHLTPSGVELKPSRAMPIGIAPEPLRGLSNGIDDNRGVERSEPIGMIGASVQPAFVYTAAIVENGIVEIQKKRARIHTKKGSDPFI